MVQWYQGLPLSANIVGRCNPPKHNIWSLRDWPQADEDTLSVSKQSLITILVNFID